MPVPGVNASRPVRALWFGMRCEFTRQALIGATAAGSPIVPVAVVLPRGPRPRAAGWPEPPFDRWLRERGIAIVEIDHLKGDDLDAVRDAIAKLGPVLGVGACFPARVPASLRDALTHGVLNIHPSLLPALRGPEPVFHAYRLGLEETGVTVHLMDHGWDSGPVLAQERVPIPASGTAAAFEARLANLGGALLAEIAPAWRAGKLAPVAQAAGDATWAPEPDEDARTISPALTVLKAARFLEACGPLLATDAGTGERVLVTHALGTESHGYRDIRGDRRVVRIACIDGMMDAI